MAVESVTRTALPTTSLGNNNQERKVASPKETEKPSREEQEVSKAKDEQETNKKLAEA